MTAPGDQTCELCGEPMPTGEETLRYHGYSGPCPKPPKPRPFGCSGCGGIFPSLEATNQHIAKDHAEAVRL